MNEPLPNPSNRARWCELIDLYLLDRISQEEAIELESTLASKREAREDYRQRCNLDAALRQEAAGSRVTTRAASQKIARWYAWRPITAAAAGIVFGMFCTSVVFGYVNQRAAMKKMPLAIFNPGLEDTMPIVSRGVPRVVGEWGADSARVVSAENGVLPKEGQQMMRLEPIPKEKNVKNLASRVYQVLDLRSQPIVGDAEVQVTASFFATTSEVSSRYLIRAFALDEPPELATKEFWSKTEDDGVVAVAQRFDTAPGDRGWQTFSLKMPLPRGAKTLVFVLGAVPLEDKSLKASIHYLDDVQVSVLTPLTYPNP